ncbi:XkdX family protein [Pediococcus pentosaceus]|nr:XkdX family protein [Pediococcus pentosaceus]
METMINIMYNSWGTLTKEEVAAYVVKTALTPEEFKEIVGEDYVAPK